MYGMVNRAIEEMVTARCGAGAWADVQAQAGVDVDVFISNESYPDAMTYALVTAAAAVVDLPIEEMLREFGHHWVLQTARTGYGDLLATGGTSLPQFLHNLPGFHARVALIYPNLQPPTFRVSHATETSLHLHYQSYRQGLQPFVVGLVEGLAAMYGTTVTVTPLDSPLLDSPLLDSPLLDSPLADNPSSNLVQSVFLIEWPPLAAAGAATQQTVTL